jgi:hypothetical protein
VPADRAARPGRCGTICRVSHVRGALLLEFLSNRVDLEDLLARAAEKRARIALEHAGPQVLSTAEVARYARVNPKTVNDWINVGVGGRKLPAGHRGSRRTIQKERTSTASSPAAARRRAEASPTSWRAYGERASRPRAAKELVDPLRPDVASRDAMQRRDASSGPRTEEERPARHPLATTPSRPWAFTTASPRATGSGRPECPRGAP